MKLYANSDGAALNWANTIQFTEWGAVATIFQASLIGIQA
jgi:hypothetical protein